jgi:DNA-binding NarL/FixJ family response regulator
MSKRLREAKKAKAKVLIVDDHPMIRHGMRELISQEADLTVVGDAEDAHEALKAIETLKPDVALIDISLKGAKMHDESLYAERALRAGAKGYIMKQEATGQVLAAIRKVLAGEIYLSGEAGSRILQRLVNGQIEPGASPVESLSDRELEVFQLIGQGLGTREIAERLFLSVKTVESYRANIKEKLKLRNSTELIQHAIQWHQVEHAAA